MCLFFFLATETCSFICWTLSNTHFQPFTLPHGIKRHVFFLGVKSTSDADIIIVFVALAFSMRHKSSLNDLLLFKRPTLISFDLVFCTNFTHFLCVNIKKLWNAPLLQKNPVLLWWPGYFEHHIKERAFITIHMGWCCARNPSSSMLGEKISCRLFMALTNLRKPPICTKPFPINQIDREIIQYEWQRSVEAQ